MEAPGGKAVQEDSLQIRRQLSRVHEAEAHQGGWMLHKKSVLPSGPSKPLAVADGGYFYLQGVTFVLLHLPLLSVLLRLTDSRHTQLASAATVSRTSRDARASASSSGASCWPATCRQRKEAARIGPIARIIVTGRPSVDFVRHTVCRVPF